MRNSCKIACFCRQKYMQLAGKNTSNLKQKYLQLQAKSPQLQAKIRAIAVKSTRNCKKIRAIAVKNTRNCRQYCYYTAGKITCQLQVRLHPANCVLNYECSRLFCMRFLSRRCRWIYLFLQVNCIRGLFTCISPHVKLPSFAGNAIMSKKLSLIPSKLQWNTPSHKKYSCVEMLKKSMQIRSRPNEANFNKENCRIDHFVISNHFWNLFANVSLTLKNEKISTQNLTHRLKKLFLINEATTFTNTRKQKRSCIQFPSFMSKQHLSTRSKTCMHLKNSNVF